jgi:hypothetical protein
VRDDKDRAPGVPPARALAKEGAQRPKGTVGAGPEPRSPRQLRLWLRRQLKVGRTEVGEAGSGVARTVQVKSSRPRRPNAGIQGLFSYGCSCPNSLWA